MSAEDEVSKLLAGAVDSRGALPNVKQGKICDMVKEWTAATDKPFISFEYFPPKTEEGVKKLHKQIEIMAAQKPLFMDFTWGAGGTTSDLTLDLSKTSQKQHNLMVNMHLTCTNQVKEKCDFGLTGAKEAGICNIVALRGDPPKGQEKWEVTEGGFACALDLVKYMRAGYGDYFSIQVAGYPEGHPDNILPTADLGRELSDREKSRTVMVEVDGNLVEHVLRREDEDRDRLPQAGRRGRRRDHHAALLRHRRLQGLRHDPRRRHQRADLLIMPSTRTAGSSA